jgi:reverse gyrase
MTESKVLYANLCPVCGRDLGSDELHHGRCKFKKFRLCSLKGDRLVREFFDFFKRVVGEPRAVQRFWAKRIVKGESFAAVAPTGIGKTSFGSVMALFLALKGNRSYIILPTTLLVRQVVGYLTDHAERAGITLSLNGKGEGVHIAYYYTGIEKEERDAFNELVRGKKFNILVTTTQYLARSFGMLKGLTFDFIFVDDVDAVLKASKNVERILALLGLYQTKDGWKGEAKGVLMVSTATAKKGQKVRLFRKLLNFDLGTSSHAARNIEDVVINSEKVLTDMIERLGKGGIIYARNGEEAQDIYRRLKEVYRVGIVTADRKQDYDLFERGELDYLVGTAYYYGTLVRGLDLPERIRFAVFVGAPVFRIRVEDIDSLKPTMIRALALIFREDERIKKLIRLLPVIERREKELKELKGLLKKLLKEGGVKEKDVVVREGEVIFPDIRTYIQGSGRTSRLYAGGITKGASFLLEDDEEILNAFIERARVYDVEFKRLEEVDFERLRREIDESREAFRRRSEFRDVIRPALFIVESPTKAKQISRFFGQPSIKVFQGEDVQLIAYEVPTPNYVLLVTASLGHITDLIPNRGFHGVLVDGGFTPVYSSIKRCRNCGHQFTEERDSCPKCKGKDIDDSKRRINALRRLAHDAEFVIIGTDPDAEGEKIAWDLRNLLSGCGTIKRAEFHEVTRRAINEALTNLRDIDENLVRAQLVRRIEDRWIGFTLSQRLWKAFNDTNLSAGRAQTPVLGWIIERARENRERKKVGMIKELSLSLEGLEKEYVTLKVERVEERVEERTPLPPYTTDSLLKDANFILKLSAKKAMSIAQGLFESGLITYHRTDSTRVSDVGLRVAKEFLGEEFRGREWFVEGAHECIRPTRPLPKDMLQRLIQEEVIQVEGITWQHLALYDLIFNRFMASQCSPYKVRLVRYRIRYDGKEKEEERVLEASGMAVELYKWAVKLRPRLREGEYEVRAEIISLPKAPLFTQSEIIGLMKERGIGRPSTYATIVDKLFIRRYVAEKNGKVFPTRRGIAVYGYLNRHYSSYVSEERTKVLELKMDAIERGELDYHRALEELYTEIRGIG